MTRRRFRPIGSAEVERKPQPSMTTRERVGIRPWLHLLSGLEVGGKERIALALARRARREGRDARLLLFDTPFRDELRDFSPGEVPAEFLRRGPGVDLGFLRRLARCLRDSGAELVHAHNDTAVFYAGAAAWMLGRKAPVVCATFHTRPGHDTRGARVSTRMAARRAARITAVSDELAQILVRDGWVGRCETLWNGVELDEFSPQGHVDGWRARLGIPPEAVLVGHIGRLDPIKRQRDLIAAVGELEREGLAIALALVGSGPALDALRAAASLSRSVHFVPRIVDVPAFLRELDLFVLCSEHEAAPRVVLEAMACGRAVVATAVGGVPHLLHAADGQSCGLLVPPGEPSSLAGGHPPARGVTRGAAEARPARARTSRGLLGRGRMAPLRGALPRRPARARRLSQLP